jgi:uncharacterized NAD(P)/FAD-binding protein YdhS
MTHAPRIAIVGGGFSGLMAAAQLVALAKAPLRIDAFEALPPFGRGVAYGTGDLAHLLNVQAGRMGAYAGKPEGFWEWLQTDAGVAAARRIRPDKPVSPQEYLPRMLYGAYLDAIREETLTQAAAKGIELHLHAARVREIAAQGKERFRLSVDGRETPFEAGALVLATGNVAASRFAFEANPPARYIGNAWLALREAPLVAQLATLPEQSAVLLIGTGLTMVDAVLTLQNSGYQGRILALSRNGLLPAPHAEYPPAEQDWARDPESAPATARGLLSGLRRLVRKAVASGQDWRAAVDGLRPVTVRLWQRLPEKERRRFLRRLFTPWNIHRHRMAWEIHDALAGLQAQGRLTVLAAKLLDISPAGGGLDVTLKPRGADAPEILRVEYALNCTGPDYTVRRQGIFTGLLDAGAIAQGPAGAGLAVDADGAASGGFAVFPMGALLLGERLECTAVPELRDQAKEVAQAVLKRIGKKQDKE